NVLQNALRHTPPSGWVRLNSRVREDGGTVLEVCDNGPGMSAETLEQIGRPFQRPDAARNREDGGAGLGIALCRTFALALGAQFELNSEPGAGTTATISLPAAPRETNA
ncbi:MAG: sensor histidine kinase, partial [Armatimonadaceae bacterium]